MSLNLLRSGFVQKLAGACAAVCAIVEPSLAASEFVDKAANVLAIFIIIAVPIGGIVLFWLVHIIPEKIAEKRQHPQKDAIHMLCLLSLVFGGLLWPLAWLWAYTKPVLHQMAYGRDKHEDYYAELPGEAQTGTSPLRLHEELGLLRHDLEQLEKQGESTDAIKAIRERLARLERRTAVDSTTGGAG